MSSKLVERCLNDFQRRCGKDGDTALELACYAAIPVALNPELLHFLRINFFFDPPKQLPYTVEFEFFTSDLCRVIDVELYEIEPEIRNELLRRLMEKNDAPQRIRDVATLLWQYVEHHSPWGDRVELERSQQLTALHFLNPKKAQEWLNEANADHSQNGGGQEWFIAMRQEINQLPPLVPDISPDLHLSLSLTQRKKLQSALIDAFPNIASLEQMLAFELDKSLRAIVGEGSLQDIVFKLIQAADSQGWVEDLVRAACKSNPGNPLLIDIAEELFPIKSPEPHKVPSPDSSSNRNSEVSTPAPKFLDDDLSSDRAIDYTRLRDLLASGNWKDADEETYLVMLKVVGREKDDWIRSEEILNFPCTDLRTIDGLWVKYSNGRFGFSVQKKIYLSVGGKPDGSYNKEAIENYGARVGWRVKENWISYTEVTFDTIAPVGHLPYIIIFFFRSECC